MSDQSSRDGASACTQRRRKRPSRPSRSSLGIGTSTEANRRATAVLEVLGGLRTPSEAAEVLNISVTHYYLLERKALHGLLHGCEPRPKGPPTPSAEKQLETLKRQLEQCGFRQLPEEVFDPRASFRIQEGFGSSCLLLSAGLFAQGDPIAPETRLPVDATPTSPAMAPGGRTAGTGGGCRVCRTGRPGGNPTEASVRILGRCAPNATLLEAASSRRRSGSAFIADLTREAMLQAVVAQLFSPTKHPEYNGSLERSNGVLKTYTHQHALQEGHPFRWTSEDLERARQLANTISRPWGHRDLSPEEA